MMLFSIEALYSMNPNPFRLGARGLEAGGSVDASTPRKSAAYLAIHREMARIPSRDPFPG
ncbi:hypothetical protein [Steroidobacter cummioxidans]|uniref:hypothetical protein n=1 Tax=Steroidobacter cummioxidans TaxID=1803913 RepID=UPI00129053B2|nr:hypothetical protein [Steroidobacter cummioxidans]